MRWCGLITATAICGSLLLPGVPAAASSRPTSITLYNGQHAQTTDAIVTAFEKSTGITVKVRSGTEDTLVNQIATEGPRSPADVIYTENSPALEFLQDRALLAKVEPTTLSHTRRQYDSSKDEWVGVSARVSVIIYNPSLISKRQLPRSVLQLADAKYRGKLAFAAAETDFQPIITAVDRAYGTAETLKWLKGIKANVAGHTYTSNETISSQVNRGAVAFGVINQYYWYRLRAEIGASHMHSRITYFSAHNPGYVIDVSGAGILKSSAHKKAAQRFLAFLVSKTAQEIIANPSRSVSYEYPIDSGITTMAPETPFDQLRPYPITVGELGDGSTAVSLLRQAGFL